VGLYCMYLCFSALQSEPKTYECNGLAQRLTTMSGGCVVLGCAALHCCVLLCCVAVLRCAALRWADELNLGRVRGWWAVHQEFAYAQSWRALRLPRTPQSCRLAGGTLALGMLVTLVSVVYAALRAGSNTSLFMLDGSVDGGDEDDVEKVGGRRVALRRSGAVGRASGLAG
jgi:hypothetical protein